MSVAVFAGGSGEAGTNQERYDVVLNENICYGTARGLWTSLPGYENKPFALFTEGYLNSFKVKTLFLNLDLYKPEGVHEKRPLIVFIHGGSFYAGDKAEMAYSDFGNYFASHGFVVASINYRLGYELNADGYRSAAQRACVDARMALRFLAEHADEYYIDTDKVFLAGSSAGSITALTIAFSPQEEDYTESRYTILAVANMWGSMEDLSLLKNSKVSIISFHGDSDRLVPYDEGHPFAGYSLSKVVTAYSEVWMYGSAAIHREAERLGLRNKLCTFPGEDHSLNVDRGIYPNENHRVVRREMLAFFRDELSLH
ncbi:MAG: carboxylesterase family protein [Bacteroidaceae bacterium]|nr:carboxylesterase family protein [Bacteroidaceae bacterium]MBP5323263.1 carboxylesterase family protein [Bacteroidaceae bacterium]